MDLLVGTFNTPTIYTLRFSSESHLEIVHRSPAIGSHSWLSLSQDRRFLYCSAWTTPPSIAAYRVEREDGGVTLLNSRDIAGRSGYVCCSKTHVYTAGGASGEVFRLAEDGSIGALEQKLSFVEESSADSQTEARPHGDFGGLRHGAHSIDLSPDGRSLYVADIGRNCIWAYTVVPTGPQILSLGHKVIAPRPDDGPRHTWPHPNGQILYCVQEHTSMVDVYRVASDGTSLAHVQAFKIIPEQDDPKSYWADEVRLSRPRHGSPKYLYASTRGLHADTKGYVAAFQLSSDGLVEGKSALDIYETPTSGGIANAVEPAPHTDTSAIDHMALTDSQEGWVFMLSFDGQKIAEAARIRLVEDGVDVVQCATAVWL